MAFIEKFLRIIPGSNLRKAMDYLNRGEYRKACEHFDRHNSRIEDMSTSREKQELIRMYMSEAYIEYSKLLKADGKFELAAETLQKVSDLEPEYSDVHYMLAETYQQLEKEEEARRSIKKALSVNPNYFIARIFLARLDYLSGKNSTGTEELDKSLSCAPGFYVEKVKNLLFDIKNNADRGDVIEQFAEILRERPTSAQVSKQMAVESIQAGKYESAIVELKKAISMNPDFPDLHNLLGIAYANTGLKDDAIVEFTTALKINPEYLKAHLNVALTFYEKGAFEESRKHLNKVMAIDPDNELARNIENELNSVGSRG